MTKYHRLGGLWTTFTPHIYGGWKATIKAPAWGSWGKTLFPGHGQLLSPCPHGRKGSGLPGVFNMIAPVPFIGLTLMTWSPPNTITLRVGVQPRDFQGRHTHSDYNNKSTQILEHFGLERFVVSAYSFIHLYWIHLLLSYPMGSLSLLQFINPSPPLIMVLTCWQSIHFLA